MDLFVKRILEKLRDKKIFFQYGFINLIEYFQTYPEFNI